MPLPHPTSDDPSQLADWLEATMLVSARKYASRTWVRIELQNSVFPEAGGGENDLDPSPLDEALDNLFGEIARRRLLSPDRYPFRVAEGLLSGVDFVPSDGAVLYAFLLLLSVSPNVRAPAQMRKVDRPFDEVVLAALLSYLGPQSVGLRFGSPASGKRPRKFGQAIEWLCEELTLPRGSGSTRGHTGDGGVDVVVWLPFRDKLGTFVAVLAQCTLQVNWHRKGRDISPMQWRAWVDFGEAPPRCLAVPFSVDVTDQRWDESRREIGVFLDRLRLLDLARRLPTDLEKTLRKWTEREIKAITAA